MDMVQFRDLEYQLPYKKSAVHEIKHPTVYVRKNPEVAAATLLFFQLLPTGVCYRGNYKIHIKYQK